MNKPVNCGCGGEAKVIMLIPEVYVVECSKCWIRTGSPAKTEAEAITIWNRSMSGNVQDCTKDAQCSERIAKVENISDYHLPINDYYFIKKGDCGNCGFTATEGDKYCRECGARLEWE